MRLDMPEPIREYLSVTQAFPHLFEPLDLRHKTLRNRITFGAHTANMAEDGLPGDRHLGYYLERALGGTGMIVVEPVPVHATAVLTRGNFRHDDDAVIPHFRKITDACHEAGAVITATSASPPSRPALGAASARIIGAGGSPGARTVSPST